MTPVGSGVLIDAGICESIDERAWSLCCASAVVKLVCGHVEQRWYISSFFLFFLISQMKYSVFPEKSPREKHGDSKLSRPIKSARRDFLRSLCFLSRSVGFRNKEKVLFRSWWLLADCCCVNTTRLCAHVHLVAAITKLGKVCWPRPAEVKHALSC